MRSRHITVYAVAECDNPTMLRKKRNPGLVDKLGNCILSAVQIVAYCTVVILVNISFLRLIYTKPATIFACYNGGDLCCK